MPLTLTLMYHVFSLFIFYISLSQIVEVCIHFNFVCFCFSNRSVHIWKLAGSRVHYLNRRHHSAIQTQSWYADQFFRWFPKNNFLVFSISSLRRNRLDASGLVKMAQTPLKPGPFHCRFSTFFPHFLRRVNCHGHGELKLFVTGCVLVHQGTTFDLYRHLTMR